MKQEAVSQKYCILSVLFRRRQQFDEVSCSSAVAHFEDGGCNDANYIKCIQFKFLNEMERKILTLVELLVMEDLPKETLILLGITQIGGGGEGYVGGMRPPLILYWTFFF